MDADREVTHGAHRPVSLGGLITCPGCTLYVSWESVQGEYASSPLAAVALWGAYLEAADLPPDFGKSGMASWTDTIAPDW